MSSGLRKRKSTSTQPRGNKKTRRMADDDSSASDTSPTNSNTDTSDTTDATDVLDSSGNSVGDVVDLTCEGSDPAVVDLTNNDSIVVVDEGSQTKSPESYVVSSDEEDQRTTEEQNSRSRATPGTISCPVCMDAYAEIVDSGRLVVSTRCGHIFCSQCLRDALHHSHSCPTCRKKLTPRNYHPIYI